ncbi:AAA family ATPase [Candidatus Sumerlaeota bacterium]|nr:AAA family ATPase [Candidatus Sumerlaeota bacterium]
MEALLKEHHPRILIFDPLTATLGERVNMNAAKEVTRLLTPVVKLAESYSCAILLICG